MLRTTFCYGNSAKLTYTGIYQGNGIYEIGSLYYDVIHDSMVNNYVEEQADIEAIHPNHTIYKKYIFSGNVVVKGEGYTYKHIINDNGVTYYCIFNENGEQMFEPVRYASNDKCICIDKDGFVYKTGNDFVLLIKREIQLLNNIISRFKYQRNFNGGTCNFRHLHLNHQT